MIQPTVFGQAIILTVYIPLLTFSGVEGKMFEPMATTVIFALIAAFILSLTFVPAMIALWVKPESRREKEHPLLHKSKEQYGKLLAFVFQHATAVLTAASLLIFFSFVLFTHLGQEFVPTLDEQDIALHAVRIPSTSLSQSTEMQLKVEKTLKQFPQVDFVFSKTGTAEMASDPMPPNVSDTFVMLRPRSLWPNPNLTKLDLIEKMETELWNLPGNNYEFTQPIEMRFNELIAGVRSDVAVKVYGDDFETMQKTADQIAHTFSTIPGAADVKVAQTDGLPVLEVTPNHNSARRLGLSIQEILDVVSTAIGGSKAGIIFEGDRRFDLIVRLPEALRNNPVALANLPVPLPNAEKGPGYVPLKEVATLEQTEGLNEISRENGKRMVAVEANVRGNDLGSFVTHAKEKIASQVKVPPGYWLEWGGTVSKPALGPRPSHSRHSPLLLHDLRPPFWSAPLYPPSPARLQRRPHGPHRRHHRLSPPRHPLLYLSCRRLHRPLRHRRPQWPRDDDLHQPADAARLSPRYSHPGRRQNAPAPRLDDRPGRLPRLCPDGPGLRNRRRSAKTARHRRHRRPHQLDLSDASLTAPALQALPAQRGSCRERGLEISIRRTFWKQILCSHCF